MAAIAGQLLGGADATPLPVHTIIDALGLCDAVTPGDDSGSKEVRAVVEDLQNYFSSDSPKASLTWILGQYQVADGLTKPTGANNLRAAISAGVLTFRSGTSHRKCARTSQSRA